MSEIHFDWHQEEVIHCPGIHCDGMLLSHDEKDYYKCSKCKKEWTYVIKWIERTKSGVKGK